MAAFTPDQLQYFEDHESESLQPNLYVCAALCAILPCTFVGLRFYARHKIGSPLMADDWLILAAMVPMVGVCITVLLATYYGEGLHIIFAKDPAKFAQCFVADIIQYTMTIVLAKSSILSLYNRLFPSPQLFRWSIFVWILVVLYSLALVLTAVLECIPLTKLWNPVEPGVCIDTKVPFTLTAALNVVTDLCILVLPIRAVWNLQMAKSRKLQIMGIFALGGVVCIFGIVRCWAVATVTSFDLTWNGVEGTIWSIVELAVGCISVCLPTLRPLIVRSSDENSQNRRTGYSSGRRYKNNSGNSDNSGDRTIGGGIKLSDRSSGNRSGNRSGNERGIWKTSTFSTEIQPGPNSDTRAFARLDDENSQEER